MKYVFYTLILASVLLLNACASSGPANKPYSTIVTGTQKHSATTQVFGTVGARR